jgi:hypothetical protein
MIAETLNLLGKLSAAPEQIVLLDGDALEINIIRDAQRMTLLNLAHFAVDEEGARVPVDPLGIQITIEQGRADEIEERPVKLSRPRGRKPSARAAKKS